MGCYDIVRLSCIAPATPAFLKYVGIEPPKLLPMVRQIETYQHTRYSNICAPTGTRTLNLHA